MTNSRKRKLREYLVTILIGIGIAVIVLIYELGMLEHSTSNVIRMVCDASFVAGVALIGAGLMTMIANAGQFYGLRYLTKVLAAKIKHNEADEILADGYYGYIKAKAGEKKEVKFILITGMGFMIIACIMLLLFIN